MLPVALLLGTALAAPRPSVHELPQIGASVREDAVRIVVLGDSGALPVANDACAAGESSCRNTAESRDLLKAAVIAEDAHAVAIMGDLVYGPHWFESTPKCRRADDRKARAWLDPALGELVEGLGAPVFVALGNHDVGHQPRSRARERCILRYAEAHPELNLPNLQYSVDLGLVRLIMLNTNVPPARWNTEAIAERAQPKDGTWVVMGGHHVIHTAFDKEHEHEIRDHLNETGIRPDLWVNGHAHFLQFGVYDGIPAATSGSASKVRVRPSCPGEACTGPDAPMWGRSTYGYAVVDATPDTLRLTFKDGEGTALWCWERTHDDPQGTQCAVEGPAAL